PCGRPLPRREGPRGLSPVRLRGIRGQPAPEPQRQVQEPARGDRDRQELTPPSNPTTRERGDALPGFFFFRSTGRSLDTPPGDRTTIDSGLTIQPPGGRGNQPSDGSSPHSRPPEDPDG